MLRLIVVLKKTTADVNIHFSCHWFLHCLDCNNLRFECRQHHYQPSKLSRVIVINLSGVPPSTDQFCDSDFVNLPLHHSNKNVWSSIGCVKSGRMAAINGALEAKSSSLEAGQAANGGKKRGNKVERLSANQWYKSRHLDRREII